MENNRSNPKQPPRAPKQRGLACLAAFLATMLAGPAGAAIDIPNDPLTTGARVAPNILFILDDSGSMAFDYMPDDVPETSHVDVSDNAYTRNTLSYNPTVTYQPWKRADGNRMSGGTSYTAAYGSYNLVGGTTIDLGDSGSCARFNYNNNATTDEFYSGGSRVCGGVQTFYVPKDLSRTDEAYLGDGRNYYRYQISSGGAQIVRAEYGTVIETETSVSVNPSSGTVRRYSSNTHAIGHVPADAQLQVQIRSSLRSVLYWVRDPGGNDVCYGQVNQGNTSTCNIDSTAAGNYSVVTRRWNNTDSDANYTLAASYETTNRCGSGYGSSGWINCSAETPTGRSLPAELSNYATWFSYHRTRMKSAKAGASEAFGSLDSTVRAGFRTIWDRSGSRFNIPVNDGNDGRFVDNEDDPDTAVDESTNSRSTWYSQLQSVIAYNGTPLKGGLQAAGDYFSQTGASGPYGPQSGGDQYTCRQNFSILTTDGYWNNSTNFTKAGVIGNADGTNGSTITGPNNQEYTYNQAAAENSAYRDSYSATLADVAMYYWKTDLRPTMANNVPTTTANPAFWQHMVTFGISIGLSGTVDQKSVQEVVANGGASVNGVSGWPEPEADENTTIDDLLHAAVNGRGAFVTASNPSEFTEGLSSALAAIAQRTSSSSNVAANSVSLDSESKIFSASYVSGIWTGSLMATEVDEDGIGAEAWTASIPAWGSRKVFTSNGGSGASFPTASQEASLARGGGPANFQVSGADNAKYIKGEQRLEANKEGTLRIRTKLLGDIINSSPAYVKDTNTIYVGANDGMLHAFNAANGRELFAFVPNIINFGELSKLSRGDYAHRYFVDGPVVVSSQRLTPSKNILVGTLGRGGKGLYALDVSTPGSFAASDFKWERAETPGNNMGQVLGKPILSRVKGNTNAAVVLGNGVNSVTEQAALLVLDAETGGVIREISTGVGSAEHPNGLFAPTGIYGPDGRTLAFVYAGDMLGNVWKFDLTNEAPGSWEAEKIFTAVDAEGNAQPITGGLAIATHPITNDRWVFFGTGRYLTVEDAGSDAVQSMYGFIDEDTPVTRDDLTERTVEVVDEAGGRRAFEAKSSLPSGSKGWYIDLPATGERIVQDAQVVSTFLVTASMMPSGNACDADGSGYINALNAFTGTSAGGSYFDTDGDGDTSDETLGDLPIGSINLGVGMPTLPNLLRGLLVAGGSGGGNPGGTPTLAPRWDRASWREIRGN